jgi:hypothetical protein
MSYELIVGNIQVQCTVYFQDFALILNHFNLKDILSSKTSKISKILEVYFLREKSIFTSSTSG